MMVGLEVCFECVYQCCFAGGLGADYVDVLELRVGVLGVIHGVLPLLGAFVSLVYGLVGLVWSGLVWSGWSWFRSC